MSTPNQSWYQNLEPSLQSIFDSAARFASDDNLDAPTEFVLQQVDASVGMMIQACQAFLALPVDEMANVPGGLRARAMARAAITAAKEGGLL